MTPGEDKPGMKLPPQVSEAVGKLRSSGLLIPIVLLVVAIIATPILLARSSDTAPGVIAGSAEAGSVEAGGSEFDPVVLTDTPGLRDYRERLDPFSSKNPFKQQLTDPPKSQEDGEAGGGEGEGEGDSGSLADALGDGAEVASGGDVGGEGDPLPDDSGGTPDPDPVPDPDPTPVPDPDGGSGGNGGNGDDDEPAEPTKATVRYGPAGNTQLLIDLKPIHEMAGPDGPLARLRRVSNDAAVFGISPEVDLGGEGSCANQSSPCNLLRLKVGQTAELSYRPTGETYRLQLLRVK